MLLAAALRVQFTPTLLFLNEQGKVILRLNGYYPPEKFRGALQYAGLRKEQDMGFTEYLRATAQEQAGQGLIKEDFFSASRDLRALMQQSSRPLAIYFQARECDDCARLHDKVLSDAPTRALVEAMDNVLLDINSDQMIVTPDGREMSQRAYANELNVQYTPSIVLLNPAGKEVHRIEGFFKTFHVQSSFAYVLGDGYRQQPSFQRYIAARGDKIREQGYTVDIYGYRSFHPVEMKMLD